MSILHVDNFSSISPIRDFFWNNDFWHGSDKQNGLVISFSSLIIHILGGQWFYRLCWLYRCSFAWCRNNNHLNIMSKWFFIIHQYREFAKFSHLSKYIILNLHNFGVGSPKMLKCSYKLLCFMIYFKTLYWS